MSSALVHVAEDTRRRVFGSERGKLRDRGPIAQHDCVLLTYAPHYPTTPDLGDAGDSFVRVGTLERIRAQRGHDVVVGLA